jgi:hypothetical protein
MDYSEDNNLDISYYEIVLTTTFQCDLYAVNSSNNFLVCGANGTYVNNICLNVTNVTLNSSQDVCNTCTSSNVYNCSLGNITGRYYTYTFYVYHGTDLYVLETGTVDRLSVTTPINATNGLIFTLIVFVAESMLMLYNPKMAILSGVVSLWAMYWFGFFLIDPQYLIGISFVGILILYKMM